MDIYKKSITELSDLLHKKSISSLEMTNYFIERIKSFDNELNSFITVDEESAKKQAINADSLIAKKNNTFLVYTNLPQQSAPGSLSFLRFFKISFIWTK